MQYHHGRRVHGGRVRAGRWLVPEGGVSAVRTLALCAATGALLMRKPLRVGRAHGVAVVFSALQPALPLYRCPWSWSSSCTPLRRDDLGALLAARGLSRHDPRHDRLGHDDRTRAARPKTCPF